jgi:hypothetical protein
MGSRGTTKETTMRKMFIPIALAATLACGFAQAQERGSGDRATSAADRTQWSGTRQSNGSADGAASTQSTRSDASRPVADQVSSSAGTGRWTRADGGTTARTSGYANGDVNRVARRVDYRSDGGRSLSSPWRGGKHGGRYSGVSERGHRYAYGRGHDRGNRYAWGHRDNRGRHYAYGHRFNQRSNGYAYGHRFNRPNHYAYGNRLNHRPQFAARGHYGRR